MNPSASPPRPCSLPDRLATRFRPATPLRGLLLLGALLGTPAGTAFAQERVEFNRHILPILSENCFFCHGPDAGNRQAGLRLDLEESAHAVLTPGDSAASELYRRITSDDPHELMPPRRSNRALSPEQVQLLRRWIDDGAAWGEHWAFAPLTRPPVPEDPPLAPGVIRNPIDAFVQARLAQEGMAPAPEAPRETLIRRVTLDLTGLPPTPEEVDAFLQDAHPRAYEKVVDRLLRSPAFGERMAWDWLDAARYADSNGYQGDRERTMWPWRDWVVRAFNDNLPYDEFTVWQLAGDLLPNATFEQRLATGFNRNHMINGEGGRIAEENRVEYVMDMAETMGTVWLGLTLNCCRCHDHKYDPLSRRDYYQLFAFFNQTPVTGEGGDPQTPPVLPVPTPEQETRLSELEERLAALDARLAERAAELAALQPAWEQKQLAPEDQELLTALRLPPDQRSRQDAERVAQAHRESDDTYNRLQAERAQARQERSSIRNGIPKVMVMEDQPEPRPTRMLKVGLYNSPDGEVTADIPERFGGLPSSAPRNRLALAQWIVSTENPLTPRVTVNRFWQQFFGIGLVKTTEDFGVQAEIPPQGELLDWLAAEFRDGGWDVKALVRLIVTSHAYRQSSVLASARASEATRRADDVDPENRLLARGPRFRMPSWMIRDQALAASGLLVPRHGGPSVNGYQPPGVWEEATFGQKRYAQDIGDALYRRSLYTFWRRIIAPTMFFDNASRQTCTVTPFRTNTPLHSLLTFNDVTYVEAARALAERALARAAAGDGERLASAFRRVLARPPSEEEAAILLGGLERSRTEFAADPEGARRLLSVGESERRPDLDAVEHAAWTALCLAILNLDEALTKE